MSHARRSLRSGTVVANTRKIVSLREEKGWSQDELAENAGFHKKTIYNLEAGKPVKSITLKTLADTLDVTMQELLLEHETLISNSAAIAGQREITGNDVCSSPPRITEGIAVAPRVRKVSQFEVEWPGEGLSVIFPDTNIAVADWMYHNEWNRFRVMDRETRSLPLTVRTGDRLTFKIRLRNPRPKCPSQSRDKYYCYIHDYRHHGPLAILAIGLLRYRLDEYDGEFEVGLQPLPDRGRWNQAVLDQNGGAGLDTRCEVFVDTVDDLKESAIYITIS